MHLMNGVKSCSLFFYYPSVFVFFYPAHKKLSSALCPYIILLLRCHLYIDIGFLLISMADNVWYYTVRIALLSDRTTGVKQEVL